MKLLTNEIRKSLPPLYATEDEKDPLVRVKFFAPWTGRTWYAIEFDGDDWFFGLVVGFETESDGFSLSDLETVGVVVGFETELGHFRLSELEALRGPAGLRVERDLYFEPARLSTLGVRRPAACEEPESWREGEP